MLHSTKCICIFVSAALNEEETKHIRTKGELDTVGPGAGERLKKCRLGWLGSANKIVHVTIDTCN